MHRNYETTEVRQRQIIDAARKVIIKNGSEHLTVKRIAKEVGISEAAIYRHYKNKRQVLSLLIENIGQALLKDFLVTGEMHKGLSLQRLDDLLNNHLSAVEQRRGVSFQIIAEIISLGDKRLNKKVTKVIYDYQNCIGNLINEGVKSGEIRADVNVGAAAMALFGIVQGTVNIWALSNYSFDLQKGFAESWKILREALLRR